MADGGCILGKLLGALLETDRVFCESFVSNLMAEFPHDPSRQTFDDGYFVVQYVAIVLGELAVTSKSDTVASMHPLSTFLDCENLSVELVDSVQ